MPRDRRRRCQGRRNRGLSGQSFANSGPVRITFDAGPPTGGPGLLALFLEDEVPQDALLNELVARFGEEARTPVDLVEQNWTHEPFQSGCVPRPTTGLITSVQDAFTRPIGNIQFAGADTSDIWKGHMDGAVRPPQRVVAEIQARTPAMSASINPSK